MKIKSIIPIEAALLVSVFSLQTCFTPVRRLTRSTNTPSITRGTPTPTYTTLTWTVEPTRFYAVQERPSLSAGAWTDYLSLQTPGWNSAAYDDFNRTNEFFRVRAYRPLTP